MEASPSAPRQPGEHRERRISRPAEPVTGRPKLRQRAVPLSPCASVEAVTPPWRYGAGGTGCAGLAASAIAEAAAELLPPARSTIVAGAPPVNQAADTAVTYRGANASPADPAVAPVVTEAATPAAEIVRRPPSRRRMMPRGGRCRSCCRQMPAVSTATYRERSSGIVQIDELSADPGRSSRCGPAADWPAVANHRNDETPDCH